MREEITVEALGVHPVQGVDDCFLVELLIVGADEKPDFGGFTQPLDRVPELEWQAPLDEKLLNESGSEVEADLWLGQPDDWPDRARVVFFLHDLATDRPLRTPFGEVPLPRPTPRPSRLAFIEYEAP